MIRMSNVKLFDVQHWNVKRQTDLTFNIGMSNVKLLNIKKFDV